MTPEAQRIAIAEACGWLWLRRATDTGSRPPLRALYHPALHPHMFIELSAAEAGDRNCSTTFLWREGGVPNYLTDLNAMHEAENYEPLDLDLDMWVETLAKTVLKGKIVEQYEVGLLLRASAEQRAEALLKTIGKWTP